MNDPSIIYKEKTVGQIRAAVVWNFPNKCWQSRIDTDCITSYTECAEKLPKIKLNEEDKEANVDLITLKDLVIKSADKRSLLMTINFL